MIEEYKKLINSDEFKKWFSKNKDSYLSSCFSMQDPNSNGEWNFDYYLPKKNKITTFVVSDEIVLNPDQKIFEKLGDIYKKYESAAQELVFEAEVFYANSENLDKSIQEMFLNLEEENINEELGKKMSELKREPSGESGKRILQEINELNKRKEDIKNGRLKK